MSSELHKYIEDAVKKKASLFDAKVLEFPKSSVACCFVDPRVARESTRTTRCGRPRNFQSLPRCARLRGQCGSSGSSDGSLRDRPTPRPSCGAPSSPSSTRASGCRPRRCASLSLIITRAAAPSEIDEELAAVTVPSSG